MRYQKLVLAVAAALVTLVGFAWMSVARAADDDLDKVSLFAALTAMSGTEPPLTLTVAASGETYTVNVTTSTKLVRRFGAKTTFSEFVIGDILEIEGTISIGTTQNTIDAKKIKNLSIQRKGGTMNGKIVSTNCAENTLIFDPDKYTNQTVIISPATKFIRAGVEITCAGLNAGERATVIGLWRPSINRINADRIIVRTQAVEGTIQTITLTDGGLPATITIERKSAKASKKDDDSKTTSTWTIHVDSETLLLLKNLLPATITDFAVGDKIHARGTVIGDKVLDALVMRNLTRKNKTVSEDMRGPR